MSRQSQIYVTAGGQSVSQSVGQSVSRPVCLGVKSHLEPITPGVGPRISLGDM
jgi:hypothetical protein